MWMRNLTRRVVRRRPHLRPPQGPSPERLEEARQAEKKAEIILAGVLSQEPEVVEQAQKAASIHQRNNLGPSFWRAMEGKRA